MRDQTTEGHEVESPNLVDGYVVAVYDRSALVGYAVFPDSAAFTIDPYQHEQFDLDSAQNLAEVLTNELASTWNHDDGPCHYHARAEPFGHKLAG